MKTKELIRLLNELDPEGELETSIGNFTIVGAMRIPGYYDGYQEVLEFNEQGHITGATFNKDQDKVVLMRHSIEDAIWDDPKFSVNYENLGLNIRESYQKRHDEIRKESQEVEDKVKNENRLPK